MNIYWYQTASNFPIGHFILATDEHESYKILSEKLSERGSDSDVCNPEDFNLLGVTKNIESLPSGEIASQIEREINIL